MSMECSSHQNLHFVLVPWMAQGHMIPMIDMARLLAERGVVVTVVTTPLNASRIQSIIDRCTSSGLRIHFLTLRFPCVEVGLPEGCENMDMLPSRSMLRNFLAAAKMLRQPLEQHLRAQRPLPSYLISDAVHPWTQELAGAFGIPRLMFHGFCSFSLLGTEILHRYKCHEIVATDSEPFVLPGLPHRVELTRVQVPSRFNPNASLGVQDLRDEIRQGELTADGMVVNSFEELEPGYAEELEKATGKKAWTIGPLSLCNKEVPDVAERGNKASIDDSRCLKWLDSMRPESVIYASFGSMARLTPPQLMEVGLGLEASRCPFIWVIKAGEKSSEVDEWLSEGFEERTRDMGLLIRGWAPQVFILSHPAIGGFLTHCGWNSTIEAVCAGLPMIACPLFGEQFLNEKLIVEVLGTAVGVGVKSAATWIEEAKAGVLVERAEVANAVERLLDGEEEGEERRKRAQELGEMARKAVREGGSSYLNVTLLIQHILQLPVDQPFGSQ